MGVDQGLLSLLGQLHIDNLEVHALSEVALTYKLVVDGSLHLVTRVGAVAPEGGRVEFSYSVSDFLIGPGDELALVVLFVFVIELTDVLLGQSVLD